MANTYVQLYVHIIFSPAGRYNLIHNNIKEELYKFIWGIISNRGQKLIIINGMPDHIHLLIGFTPEVSLSNLVRDIKAGSSKFINENKLLQGIFSWQRGFGAFTYSRSQLPDIIRYIENQEKHHRKKTFKTEYIEFLDKFGIDYKPEYLFEWIN